MRRSILTVLSAALLVLMALPAFAQYPPPPPGDTPAETIGCTITVQATEKTEGQWSCVAAYLKSGSRFTFTATFPRLKPTGAFSQFDTAGTTAVAFVGAQSDGVTATIEGTVDGDGVARGAGPIPAGADTSAAVPVSFFGTADDGEPISLTTTVNAPAAAPGGPATTPATGAESGILALIALGLVGAGGGAVMMARRKSRLEV